MTTSSTAATWVHIDTLQPWDKNPRNNEEAARQLAANIKQFGFTVPLVVQAGTNRIIAGHTRQKAVRMLMREDARWAVEGAPAPGMLPVRYIAVDDKTATKLTISDNQLGGLAEWNEAQLSELLIELGQFEVQNLGFDQQELSALLGTWEDPYATTKEPTADEPEAGDSGTAKITVELAIPLAQDAAQSFRTALEAMGVARSSYKLEIR